MGWTIVILEESFIGIWSLRIFSLIRMEIWKLQILDLLELLAFLSKLSLMRSKHFGTELLKFYLDKNNIVLELIFGQLDASLQNLFRKNQCSMEILKLIKSSKSSSSTVPQLLTNGQISISCLISNQLSPNSKESIMKPISRILTQLVWTCAWKCWLWIHPEEFQWNKLWNTHISQIFNQKI